jgi:hypothetical protein
MCNYMLQIATMGDDDKGSGFGTECYMPLRVHTPQRSCTGCMAAVCPKRCTNCKSLYCTRECQRKDWKKHKAWCRANPCERKQSLTDTQVLQQQEGEHEEKSAYPYEQAEDESSGVERSGCPWSTWAHPHDCQSCIEAGVLANRWHTPPGSGECDMCMPCSDEECILELQSAIDHGRMSGIGAHLTHGHCINACPRDFA